MLRLPPLLARAPASPAPTAQPLPPWLSYSAWTTSLSPVATISTAGDGRARTLTHSIPETAYSIMHLPLTYSGPTPYPSLGSGWTVPAPTAAESGHSRTPTVSSLSPTRHTEGSMSNAASTPASSSPRTSAHQSFPQASTTNRPSAPSNEGSIPLASSTSSETTVQAGSSYSPSTSSASTSVATSGTASSDRPSATVASNPASTIAHTSSISSASGSVSPIPESSSAATSQQPATSASFVPTSSAASLQPQRHTRLSGGQIAGIAVGSFFGALALLALLTFLLWLVYRRRRRRNDPYDYEDRYTSIGLLGSQKLEDGGGGGPEQPRGLMARFFSARQGGKGAYAVVGAGAAASGVAGARRNGTKDKQKISSLHTSDVSNMTTTIQSAGQHGSHAKEGPPPVSLLSNSGARYPAHALRSTGISDRTLSGGVAGLGAFAGAAERRRSSNRRPESEEDESDRPAPTVHPPHGQRNTALSDIPPDRPHTAAGAYLGRDTGASSSSAAPMPLPPPPERRTWGTGTSAPAAASGPTAMTTGRSGDRPGSAATADEPARRGHSTSPEGPGERDRTIASADTSAWTPSLTVTSPSVSTFHTSSAPHRPSQQLLYGRTLAVRPELGASNETFGQPDMCTSTPDPYVDATSEPWEQDSRSTRSRHMPGAFSPSPLRGTPEEDADGSWLAALAHGESWRGRDGCEQQSSGADGSEHVFFDGRRLSTPLRNDERTCLSGLPEGSDDAVIGIPYSLGTGYSVGTPTPQGLASSELDPMSASPVVAPLPPVSTAAPSLPPTGVASFERSSAEEELPQADPHSSPQSTLEHARSNSLGIIFDTPQHPQAGGSPVREAQERPNYSPEGTGIDADEGESSPLFPLVPTATPPRSIITTLGTKGTSSPETGRNGHDMTKIMEVSSHFPSTPVHPAVAEAETPSSLHLGADADTDIPIVTSTEESASRHQPLMDGHVYGEDTWTYGAPLSDIEERSEAQSMNRTTSDWTLPGLGGRTRPVSQAYTLGGRPASQSSSSFAPSHVVAEEEAESLHPPSWRPSPRVRTAAEKAQDRLSAHSQPGLPTWPRTPDL